MRRILAFFVLGLVLLLAPYNGMAQCNWSTKVVLNWTTIDQPGLTNFTVGSTNKLFLSFVGTDSNRTVNVAQSSNGTSYTNLVTLTNFMSSKGVAISGSPATACSAIYLAFPGRDSQKKLNVSKSADGISWGAAVPVYSGSQSTPALNTAFGGVGIGFNFPSGLNYNWAGEGSCDCNMGNIQMPIDTDYWAATDCREKTTTVSCPTFSNGSPGWGAAVVQGYSRWIKVVAQPEGFTGPPENKSYPKLILYQADNTGSSVNSFGTHWSSAGVTAAVNPANSQRYIAWRGGNQAVVLANVDTGGLRICSDWSPSTPTIAFFQNKLFVAWRGGDNKIGVASLNPF